MGNVVGSVATLTRSVTGAIYSAAIGLMGASGNTAGVGSGSERDVAGGIEKLPMGSDFIC